MKRKPYVVEIEERFHKSIIVYAKSNTEAEVIAERLCENGIVDLERNCYAGRTCESLGHADKNDLSVLDVYDT